MHNGDVSSQSEVTILYILLLPNDGLLKATTCSSWSYVKLYILFDGHVYLFILY